MVIGEMKKRQCPVIKRTYIPGKNVPGCRKVAVFFKGKHNHPPWPLEKVGTDAKEAVIAACKIDGKRMTTADGLDKGKYQYPEAFALSI